MSDPLIPSAMDESRLLLMQGRADRGEPIAQASDSDAVTASIQRRHAKTAKNGYSVAARAVGQGSKNKKQITRCANFNDEGEEYDRVNEFTLMDQYLKTPLGSESAARAMAVWRQSLGR